MDLFGVVNIRRVGEPIINLERYTQESQLVIQDIQKFNDAQVNKKLHVILINEISSILNFEGRIDIGWYLTRPVTLKPLLLGNKSNIDADLSFCPDFHSTVKNVRISNQFTAFDVICVLFEKYHIVDPPDRFALYIGEHARKNLCQDTLPLLINVVSRGALCTVELRNKDEVFQEYDLMSNPITGRKNDSKRNTVWMDSLVCPVSISSLESPICRNNSTDWWQKDNPVISNITTDTNKTESCLNVAASDSASAIRVYGFTQNMECGEVKLRSKTASKRMGLMGGEVAQSRRSEQYNVRKCFFLFPLLLFFYACSFCYS